MKKRIISMLLVIVMLFGTLPTATFAANGTTTNHPFTDVKARDWYDEYVAYVWEHGLFNGVTATTFAPKDKLTRGMFVTVLGRMAGVDTDEYTEEVFSDVDPAAWYGPYVAWAAENGITTGVGDGLFAPNTYVTREQIAAFIMRYLALIGYDMGEGKDLSYADKDSISDYAREAAAVCSGLGLFQGDNNNRFRPKDNANRAEAATICARLHQLLNGTEAPGKDDDAPTWSPIIPDGGDDGEDGEDEDLPGTTTTYHKVTFANPAADAYAASVLPDSTLVEKGSLVYNLPLPERSNYVFCGWFYDENLTQLAATTDTVTADMTLYPKMVERTGSEEDEWPVYALNYVAAQNVGSDYTVQVQASSEQQIRDNLTFAAFSERNGRIDYDIVSNGNGIYTLKPVGGLVAGDTYQVIANDRDREPEFNDDGSIAEQDYVLFLYGGEVMPSGVQYYNITVAGEEHNTMRIDDKVIFLPFDQVSGMDLENAMLYTMSEEGFEINDTSGTFFYEGDALSVGDVVAIYDGILNGETREVDGELAYVKITKINGNTYSYGIPGIQEVLFTPLALPIPLDDTATEEVDGAFFNEEGTVTVYNEYLDFSDFAKYEGLSLDGETTAEVGDYLVLYTGEVENPSSYAYYEITDIRYGGSSAVTEFTVIEREEVAPLSVYEVYTGDLGITSEALAELEAETEKQAIESGFAEEAADYLAAVLLSGEEMQETFGGYTLKSVKLRSSSNGREWYEGGEWNPNVGEDQSLSIEAGAIEAGVGTLMVEVGKVDVHVDSSTSLKEITAMEKGLRLELGLTFTVQIGNYVVGTGWADCINLQVSASFVQEVGFNPFASIKEVKGKWLGFIPGTVEYRVNAGVDVGTYVGVGATFTVISADDFDSVFPWEQAIRELDPNYDPGNPNVDSIARQIKKMMGDETTFALGNGKESLVSIYQDLLEKEIDYVEILAIKCPGCPINIPLPYKIGQIRINLELVISAKMSVTVGLAMETLSVRRYEFNAWINIKDFEAGYSTNSMDLQTPYSEINLYIMGNIGLRVGPRISVELHLLNVGSTKKSALATAGFSLYFGYTIDMYGIYFMHMRVENGKVTPASRDVGALEANHGIFLDLDFHLGVILDLIAVDIHALDLTWNILDKKGTPKVFEATQRTHDAKMWNSSPYRIDKDLLKLNTLIVKTGLVGQKTSLSHKDFNVELSNPYFTYNPGDGSISVTAPEGSVKEECEVRLTYKGSDTLFSVTPITIIIDLTWEKIWPNYFIRFCSDYIVSDGEYIAISWSAPVREYRFVEGEAITGIEAPTWEIAGYDFLGWYYMDDSLEGVDNGVLLSDLNDLEGYIMPGGDINLGAKFRARDDTPYTLNYYIETVAGTGAYELYKTVEHRTTTDAYIPAAGLIIRTKEDLGDMDGFRLRYDLLPMDESRRILGYVPVRGDGSGSGDIYLDRNSYSVYYHTNNKDYTGATVIQTGGVYGAELAPPPDLVNADVPGWTFVGWKDSEGNWVDIPATVPTDTGKQGITVNSTYYSNGTHYFAQWEPSFNYYTVNHYVINPDGEYELVETQVGSDSNPDYGGYTGNYITVSRHVKDNIAEGAKYSHYDCMTADGVETTRIAGVPGSGSGTRQHNGQVLDIYYDREYIRAFWDSADGEILQYYYPGQTIIAPEGLKAEEKPGYIMDGWKNTTPGSENDGEPEIYREAGTLVMGERYKTFEPNYIPAGDIKYTVIHKRPNSGSYGTFTDETQWETEVYYGTTDTLVTAEVKQYDGFITPEEQQLYIKGDGSSVIEYEYLRQTYKVFLDYADGSEVITRSYDYGLPFKLPLNVTREGYEFKGWLLTTEGFTADIDEHDGYVYDNCLTSMQDLTFTAQWEIKQIDYQVEHYLEQLDGSYTLQQTDKFTAAFDETVTAAELQFAGFSYDEENADNVTEGKVAADGSLVLKLYYTRNSYEAVWYDYDGANLLAAIPFKYGEIITIPEAAASRTGYTWDGWNIGSVTMSANGASFNAKDHGIWTANTYTVAFDANGGTGTMENQSMTYDQIADLSANAFVRVGYTFAGWSLSVDGEAVYSDRAQVSNLTADADGSVTLYAQWAAGEGTAYKVEYYLENLAGDGYDVQEEVFYAVTGSTASATAKSIPGFTHNSDAPENVLSGVVTGDGSLILKLYYSRSSYTLTLDFNGESLKQSVENPDTYKQEIASIDIEDRTFRLKYGQPLSGAMEEITIQVIDEDVYPEWDDELGDYVYTYKDVPFETAFPGYTFKEWIDCPDTMPAEDLTLTAEWTPMDVTVRLFPGTNQAGQYGEQVSGEPIVFTAKYGDVIDLTSYGYTHEGYEMIGWNYDTIMTAGAEIVGELVLVDGYYSYNGGYSVSEGNTDLDAPIPKGEMHLYAFWIANEHKHTIIFDGNGGIGNMGTQVISTSGTWTALKKNQFVREGYRFVGWSTGKSFDDGDFDCNDRDLITWDSGSAAETIFYAQWEKITE